ncbi:unnamed protein product [Rotaria sp. Silwood1]|nr:unnamed protein product [Rotaria sp. Silwood1]
MKIPPEILDSENVSTGTDILPIKPQSETISFKMRDDLAMERFSQLSISTSDPLRLIYGYLNEPLVSLEEALQPFHDQIDQLSHFIKEAKTECYYPSEHNLTRDESAAIYIYTMKWGNHCLYDHLQEAWKTEDRATMKRWFKYLRLFKSAFDKLPDSKRKIWQGVPFDEKLIEKLNSKSSSLYISMGLCLPSSNQIKDYLQNNFSNKIILIGYETVKGKSIADYTANSSNEHMVFPGMKIAKANCSVRDANGSVIYHLKGQNEIDTNNVDSQVHSITDSNDSQNSPLDLSKTGKFYRCLPRSPDVLCVKTNNTCDRQMLLSHLYDAPKLLTEPKLDWHYRSIKDLAKKHIPFLSGDGPQRTPIRITVSF